MRFRVTPTHCRHVEDREVRCTVLQHYMHKQGDILTVWVIAHKLNIAVFHESLFLDVVDVCDLSCVFWDILWMWYSPVLIRRDFLKVSYFVHTCVFLSSRTTQAFMAVFPQTLSFHFTPTHTLSLHAGWQRLQHWKVSITVLISLQRINWFYCCADGTFGVINFFNLFKMSQDGGECIYFTAATPVGSRRQLWLAQYLLN